MRGRALPKFPRLNCRRELNKGATPFNCVLIIYELFYLLAATTICTEDSHETQSSKRS